MTEVATTICETIADKLIERCSILARERADNRLTYRTNSETLKTDCDLGRALRASEAFCPDIYKAWIKTPDGMLVDGERDDLVRLAIFEEQAAAWVSTQSRDGDYSFGSMKVILAKVEGRSDTKAATDMAHGKSSGLKKKDIAAADTDAGGARRRVTAKVRDRARSIGKKWRNTNDPGDLDEFAPLAQSMGLSVPILVERTHNRGPWRMSLMKAVTKRFT